MPAAPPTDRVPDDELLRRAAAGDAQAFAELFRRRHPDVFRFALHLTGSAATAEDVVQDVFMIVARDGARYDAGRATVAAWLCGIARNLVRQRLERDRRLTPVDSADDGGPSAVDSGAVDPLAGLLRDERIKNCAVRCRRCPCRIGKPWCCATCRRCRMGTPRRRSDAR